MCCTCIDQSTKIIVSKVGFVLQEGLRRWITSILHLTANTLVAAATTLLGRRFELRFNGQLRNAGSAILWVKHLDRAESERIVKILNSIHRRTRPCRKKNHCSHVDSTKFDPKNKKANSTLGPSRAVPHPSTDRAFRRLTSEFGWDRVYLTKYGRWQELTTTKSLDSNFPTAGSKIWIQAGRRRLLSPTAKLRRIHSIQLKLEVCKILEPMKAILRRQFTTNHFLNPRGNVHG